MQAVCGRGRRSVAARAAVGWLRAQLHRAQLQLQLRGRGAAAAAVEPRAGAERGAQRGQDPARGGVSCEVAGSRGAAPAECGRAWGLRWGIFIYNKYLHLLTTLCAGNIFRRESAVSPYCSWTGAPLQVNINYL